MRFRTRQYGVRVNFTALHRLLGRQPGPLLDEMLDEAVGQHLEETDDLDWKKDLPPAKGITQTDFPKDVAAMANSGGGVIVYGIAEKQKAATERLDIGEVDEPYQRTMRSAAVTAISPPVLGLGLHRLGEEGRRALVVVVPASIDVPHLIYRGEYFGAPVRNDADTVWMRERQIEAMYRARLDQRRNAHEALDSLYNEAAAGRPVAERAWMIGVARPRVPPPVHARMTRDEATKILRACESLTLSYADNKGPHPLASVSRENPRPGLRRWVAPTTVETDSGRWKEAWASVHDDGSVTLASAIGGRPELDEQVPAWLIDSARAERFVADLMALLRSSSDHHSTGDYEVRVGIEWEGQQPLVIQTVDQHEFPYSDASIPVARYTPITVSVRTDVGESGFLEQVRDLATDVINQGGIQNVRTIKNPN